MSLYNLYPHQQEALDKLRSSFRRGNNRPLVYASVAFGKTVLAAHIVASALDKGNSVCFVVPFTVLIDQTAKSFEAQGLPKAGIIQASHKDTDKSKRLQIASVQTLARRKVKEFDLYIVDEAHVIYKTITNIMETTDKPFVGLSGSPYTKGLGKMYDDLVSTKTMAQLIDEGFLSPYTAFASKSADMTGVKTSMGDFQAKQAGERASKPEILNDIAGKWLKYGNNEPTICYAHNVKHANFLGSEFDRIGVSNKVITAKTPMEERQEIFTEFEKGYIKILINVGTLTTGMDKDVRCLIFARATKSQILFVQMCGRALRMADGKDRAIMIDAGGNFERLGFPEDISITHLDDGENDENSKAKKADDSEEAKPKACAKCGFIKEPKVRECDQCGFTPRATQDVEGIDGELVQISGSKKSEKATMEEKQQFYAELIGYQQEMRFKGKNYSDGYISHLYKSKFKVWPRGMRQGFSDEPSESTRGFIKSRQIAYAKSKSR